MMPTTSSTATSTALGNRLFRVEELTVEQCTTVNAIIRFILSAQCGSLTLHKDAKGVLSSIHVNMVHRLGDAGLSRYFTD